MNPSTLSSIQKISMSIHRGQNNMDTIVPEPYFLRPESCLSIYIHLSNEYWGKDGMLFDILQTSSFNACLGKFR